MNLLAKRLGQLAVLAVALFFFSCEDPTSLGFENPQKKYNINFVDIPLETSVLVYENIITDNKVIQDGNVQVGKYQDPLLGTVRATPFLKFNRTYSPKLSDTLVYDSITIRFRLNLYSYGFDDEVIHKFSVHEITSDTIGERRRQYNNSTFGYNPEPLGTTSFEVDYDELQDNAAKAGSQQDTLLVEIKLSDEFGLRLFNEMKTNEYKIDTTKASEQQRLAFHSMFKGLALVPDESINSVIGLNVFSSFSDITVFYHTPNKKSKGSKSYLFTSSSFTNISSDRATSELSGAGVMQDFDPVSGNRFIQNGSPVITKVDLSKFYEFADQDSARDIVVNSAELLIDGIEYPAGITPHASFTLQVMKEGNLFMDYAVDEDSAAMRNNYVVAPAFKHYFVYPDAPASAQDVVKTTFNNTKKHYSTYITRFTQMLTRNLTDENGINENRIKYLALIPMSPTLERGVHRTVFHKDKIRLRIHYTRPTQINPE